MILELASEVEQLPFAVSIAEADWLFPILEIAHVFAICLVVGSIAMVDLRLLGVGAIRRRASELIAQMLPWTWSAFAVALISGALMFASKATSYLENPFFQLKLAGLALAGINMLAFHLGSARRMAQWNTGVTPVSAKWAGACSLSLWVTIVALGRWIGFFWRDLVFIRAALVLFVGARDRSMQLESFDQFVQRSVKALAEFAADHRFDVSICGFDLRRHSRS